MTADARDAERARLAELAGIVRQLEHDVKALRDRMAALEALVTPSAAAQWHERTLMGMDC